jgi:hypothetical protein
VKRQRALIGSLLVTTLVAVATALWIPLDRRIDSWTSAQADRAFAPHKRFYDETDALRREARSATPDPSLVPRASALLVESERFSTDWNYGNAIHYANLFLGRVALQRGNIVEARTRLLSAARTPGSPQLSDYGPDMTLADELLDRGESAVVLEYFKRCNQFWRNSSRNKLNEWAHSVSAGQRPQFGKRSARSDWRPQPNSG